MYSSGQYRGCVTLTDFSITSRGTSSRWVWRLNHRVRLFATTIKSISTNQIMLSTLHRILTLAASACSKKTTKATTWTMQLPPSIKKKKVLTAFGLLPAHSKMKEENTITRFKNLTLLNWVEFASEWKTSSVIRFPWVKVSFTTRNSKKLRRSKESRILVMTVPKTRFSAESAGAPRKTWTTH